MYNVYKVKMGDTISEIAKMFNISSKELMNINNMTTSKLSVGEEIIVPKNNETYFEYYSIKKGDNLYNIAKRYNINPDLLATLNGLNNNDYIYPDQVILIPKSDYSYYVTKSGDTLDSVANILGMSREDFLNENDVIYLLAGQLLVKKTK